MNSDKRIAVYYRSIPSILEKFIAADKLMVLTKDGVHKGIGHACPRMTIVASATNNASRDKERMAALERLLDELVGNNQLVGYSGL